MTELPTNNPVSAPATPESLPQPVAATTPASSEPALSTDQPQQNSAPSQNSFMAEHARAFDRIWASLLDGIFTALILIPLDALLYFVSVGHFGLDQGAFIAMFQTPMVLVLNLVIVLAYNIIYVNLKQATPGKQMLHIKVVKHVDGSKLEVWQIVLREIIKAGYSYRPYGSTLLIISVLIMCFNKERRMLHDLLSGSYVVKE